jgi:hypothetical protein
MGVYSFCAVAFPFESDKIGDLLRIAREYHRRQGDKYSDMRSLLYDLGTGHGIEQGSLAAEYGFSWASGMSNFRPRDEIRVLAPFLQLLYNEGVMDKEQHRALLFYNVEEKNYMTVFMLYCAEDGRVDCDIQKVNPTFWFEKDYMIDPPLRHPNDDYDNWGPRWWEK